MKPLTHQTLSFLPRAGFTRQSLNRYQVGNLLRAEEPKLSPSLLSSSLSFWISCCLCVFLYVHNTLCLRHLCFSVVHVLACSACKQTFSQWIHNKRGGERVCRVCFTEMSRQWNSESDGLDGVCAVRQRQVRSLRDWVKRTRGSF